MTNENQTGGFVAETTSAVDETETQEMVVATEPKDKSVTMWNDKKTANDTYKMAKIIAQTTIIPQSFRNKPGDCLVVIDMANRMAMSPIFIMQNSQLVNGNFSWRGSACKSMIDGCGRYISSEYVEVGERDKDSWGYYLQAVDKNGKIVNGVAATIAMAKSEGWYDRNPKWKSMPELMLKYRCASFFAKTECPAVLMGFQTAEENQDIMPADDKNVVTIELNESEGK